VKKEDKEKIVRELEETFARSSTYYLVDFKRMNVAQSVELRKLLRKNSHSLRVVKNRLVLKALKDSCPEPLRPTFQSSTALAFTNTDPVGLAKTLKDFSAQGKLLAVKGGVVEGRTMDADLFEEICRLGSRDDVLGKIGYLMAYPLTQFLRTITAPLSQMGILMGQLNAKKTEQGQ
jgi:large subunit ribosomal protein L10